MLSSAAKRKQPGERRRSANRGYARRKRRQHAISSLLAAYVTCRDPRLTEAFTSSGSVTKAALFATIENGIDMATSEDLSVLRNGKDLQKPEPTHQHYFLHENEQGQASADMHLSKHFGSVENFRKLAIATPVEKQPYYARRPSIGEETLEKNGVLKKYEGQANGKTALETGSLDDSDSLSGFDGLLDNLEHNAKDQISEFSEEFVTVVPANTTSAADRPSRTRRVLRAARKAWWYISPVHIFTSLDLADDGAFDSLESATDDEEPTQRPAWRRGPSTREDRRKKKQLSNLLKNVNLHQTKRMAGITSRTLTGLILALAEEAEGIAVRIDAREETPIWRKQIDSVKIEFTRLGFKPLYMGGPDQQLVSHDRDDERKNKAVKPKIQPFKNVIKPFKSETVEETQLLNDDEDSCPVEYTLDDDGIPIGAVSCADTAFRQIDVDNSGALDEDEIADALVLAASASSQSGSRTLAEAAAEVGEGGRRAIQQLAKQLVDLYDTNDDGVIDRMEYQSMVEDMAALRQVQREKQQKQEERSNGGNIFDSFWNTIRGDQDEAEIVDQLNIANATDGNELRAIAETAIQIQEPETTGKIVLENVKVDLRQVVFGAIPFVKRILPGGPLFLEPLKATVTASFTADDILKSTLCYAGLRQLVTFALRVRVRSLRDLADGAVFYGRKWKRDSTKAPQVECTELISIEIDDQDRAIITGRAKVQASEDAPVIENSFKLRTKVATPRNGRAIKLSEPEIAIVLECPPKWEENINATFAKLGMKPPSKPKPIFTYIPIHSPFKKNDDTGGYYMGEDNRLNSLYIKDKCLRFEMEAILRPGKFLGSHYLAFTVPQRALIVTVDRVKEGMRAARKRKKALKALKRAEAEETDKKAHHAEDALHLEDIKRIATSGSKAAVAADAETDSAGDVKEESKGPTAKGFISRFVDGYVQAGEVEESTEKLAHAISDWFGRQGLSTSKLNNTDIPESDAVKTMEETMVESAQSGNVVSKVVEVNAFEQMGDDKEVAQK